MRAGRRAVAGGPLRALAFLLLAGGAATPGGAEPPAGLPPVLLRGADDGSAQSAAEARPLDRLVLRSAPGTVEVRDGAHRLYFAAPTDGQVSFLAGGALGRQEVLFRDGSGREGGRVTFTLEAETSVDDGGKYRDMFGLFRKGMNAYSPTGVESTVWNGRTYHYFVNWVLDNYHTSKGMKYFSPVESEFIDLMRAAQREDGMIWSNINSGEAVSYYLTAYGPFGYVRKYGDRYFVRQPAENHPEYVYVSSIYQAWKASGDDAWMRQCLGSAMRALDYSMSDPARWSARFQLLKRVYTIDSWDFQIDDAYTPDIGLTNTMLIDPVKSKFGVFFGDNVYYAAACEELSEMLDKAGNPSGAARLRERSAGIRQRLDGLSWNGRFFTHFIDEDPGVRRDLGVDPASQIAQGNAYALNRGIGPEHAAAIIGTYRALMGHLPQGSPGEWYSIYPPFPRGFEREDKVWQYMNGGVGGHVAGELARGAFEFGEEAYGRSILDRLTDLGHRHGDKIWFCYTGSVPDPPAPPTFHPVDLSAYANMDLEVRGGQASAPWMLGIRVGDDIRGLPAGLQQLAGITFRVADPAANLGRSAVALSHRAGLPPEVDIPVDGKAACVYLLHTSTKPGPEKVCGSVDFVYKDGTRHTQYMIMGQQLTYWWFPELKTDHSGVAWHGPSPVSADVGLSWAAVDNPDPDKVIRAIRLRAPEDDGIYTVVGLTLADRPHYVRPDPVSFGGPDNWAAATAMAALIEGLAGVKDAPHSEAFSHPVLAPRWDLAQSRSLRATVRYAASTGYVAYRFVHSLDSREIDITLTGSGETIDCHLPLPPGAAGLVSLEVDGEAVRPVMSAVGRSPYADFILNNTRPHLIRLRY
jgi:hypothetical protein